MRVVVTGGTGFIGRQLVRRLLERGHQVSVLTRDRGRAAPLLPARATLREWDVQRALEPDVVAGADAVINLAGEGVADARWSASRKAAIRDSRVLGTRAVVRALGALAPADRPRVLVSASAIGYYGDRGGEELDEASAPGAGFLADVCRAWEHEAGEARALGVRTAIVRIGLVLGRDGGALGKMLPPFRLGLGGRLGSGKQWMSWIHLHDLVELFRFALEEDRVDSVLGGVAPVPVTNAGFTRALGAVLGRPTLLPAPAAALRLALGEMSAVLLASQRVLPRAATRLGFSFRYPELEPALRELCQDGSHELEYEQWIAQSPAKVFAFFADPANLERLTPKFLHFQMLGVTTSELREGTRLDYRLSLRGLPVRWQSLIESWEPERRFVDVQTRGPYALWRHTHEFEAHDGGTLIRDRVRYALPLGVLGDLVAGRWVVRDLEAIFEFRRKRIRELLA